MMLKFILPFFLLAVPAAAVSTRDDSTITKVVKLLQEMLDKSKGDGTDDRTVFAKFKCYCDTTTAEKKKAIEETTAAIEAAEAQLNDLRAMNTKLSQEVAKLESDMASNAAAREEATAIRNKEKEDFTKEEADLVTGVDQLDRAVNLLAAVGADQTASGDTDSAQLTAGAASEKAGFMTKSSKLNKRSIKLLGEDMKKALRAASIFLNGKQRAKIQAFLQAPFTGNYNAQSGEIVGVLKSMADTFKTNLDNARIAEEKKQKEYDEMMEVKTEEYDEMKELFDAKKKEIGDNAAQISTISSEVDTMESELAADQEFLATLTDRCSAKAKEFEKRNMLRAGEEAAIAEAISILNSDAAFASFGKVDATSTGSTGLIQRVSLLQMSKTTARDIRNKASEELLLTSHRVHSVRVARVAMAISDGNPFKKVLEMINKTVSIIEQEEKDDVLKKETCISEQTASEENKEHKETDIQTLESNINELKVAIEGTMRASCSPPKIWASTATPKLRQLPLVRMPTLCLRRPCRIARTRRRFCTRRSRSFSSTTRSCIRTTRRSRMRSTRARIRAVATWSVSRGFPSRSSRRLAARSRSVWASTPQAGSSRRSRPTRTSGTTGKARAMRST
jgi:cell division protein FtsB